MKKNSKSGYQRNEALFTCGLIIVLYAVAMVTYIAAGHSCASGMGWEGSKICEYKAQADTHLGNFPEYTAWLEHNFHVGLKHVEQKLHG